MNDIICDAFMFILECINLLTMAQIFLQFTIS